MTKWQLHSPATQRPMAIRLKNLVIMGSGVSEVLLEIAIQERNEQMYWQRPSLTLMSKPLFAGTLKDIPAV